jgi:hypothetical protein
MFSTARPVLLVTFVLAVLNLLIGCTATHTAINKRHLDVQTKMSSTIFLDPVCADKRTIFVQLRNTSDKQELELAPCIIASLGAKGYVVVDNPEQAQYLLQANVLQVGKTDLRAAEHALCAGFGAAITGAAAGAAVGSLVQQEGHQAAVAGGLVGAAVATVADAMVKDVVYTVIADVQISERAGNAMQVKEKSKSKLAQGTSGYKEITSTQKIHWNRYQTRIVSTANKVNLKFEKAAPLLVEGLSRSLAGIF